MPVRSHWNIDIISPTARLSDRFAPFIAHKNLKQDTAVTFLIADNMFLLLIKMTSMVWIPPLFL